MRELREWGKAVLIDAFATTLVAWRLSATWALRPLPRALRSLAGLLMILVVEVPSRIAAPILLILFHSMHIRFCP